MRTFRKLLSLSSSQERFFFAVATIVFIAAAITLITLFITNSTVAAPAQGGSWHDGVIGQPVLVNPILMTNDAERALVRLTHSQIGELAQKIEPVEQREGRVWRVRLKEGVTWHDGERLTSDDLIFTIQKIQEAAPLTRTETPWQGVLATRLSELEIQITIPVPYVFFDNVIRETYVVARHIYKDVPVANWHLSQYTLGPVGSGPYAFASLEKNKDGFITHYSLNAWEHYFQHEPYIGSFVVHFFSNTQDLLEDFNKGKIQGFFLADPTLLSSIDRSFDILAYPQLSLYSAIFNAPTHPALAQHSVRKALSLAIDRQKLIDEVWRGHGQVPSSPLPNSLLQSASTTPIFDLEQARNVLESDGWSVRDGGIRSKELSIAEGTASKKQDVRLELVVTVPQIPFLVNTAAFLQKSWKEIGVEATVNVLPLDELLHSAIRDRDYQILLFGNAFSYSPDLYAFWHSSARFYPGLNFSGYNNRQVDTLLTKIRTTWDSQEREREIQAATDLINGEVPALFLSSADAFYVTGAHDLKGHRVYPIASPEGRYNGVHDWHVRTRRAFK